MLKKFEVNWTKIKGGCQLYTKAAPWESMSDLTLAQMVSISKITRRMNFTSTKSGHRGQKGSRLTAIAEIC